MRVQNIYRSSSSRSQSRGKRKEKKSFDVKRVAVNRSENRSRACASIFDRIKQNSSKDKRSTSAAWKSRLTPISFLGSSSPIQPPFAMFFSLSLELVGLFFLFRFSFSFSFFSFSFSFFLRLPLRPLVFPLLL